MKRALIIFAILVNTQLLMQAPSFAVDDPDWGVEIQNNTQCSLINTAAVNIRSGPGTDYSVVTKLDAGDGVRAVYREGDWVKVAARQYFNESEEDSNARFEPLEGWVNNQYINGCSEPNFDQWRQ
jgi:SH3-like domain-containing protein